MSDKRIQQLRLQLHPHAPFFLNPQTMFIAAVATVHTKKMEELVSQLVSSWMLPSHHQWRGHLRTNHTFSVVSHQFRNTSPHGEDGRAGQLVGQFLDFTVSSPVWGRPRMNHTFNVVSHQSRNTSLNHSLVKFCSVEDGIVEDGNHNLVQFSSRRYLCARKSPCYVNKSLTIFYYYFFKSTV